MTRNVAALKRQIDMIAFEPAERVGALLLHFVRAAIVGGASGAMV